MGCDIHSWAEKKTATGYEAVSGTFTDGPCPFDWRSYGMFAFLSGLRNYSQVTPISEPRGFPDDLSDDGDRDAADMYGHSPSWLSVSELVGFDYEQQFEDRRITVQTEPNIYNGSGTAEPGGGFLTTYRTFLGAAFFADLKTLQDIGADRVVFWFDN